MADGRLTTKFSENAQSISIKTCSVIGLGLIALGIYDIVYNGKLSPIAEFLGFSNPVKLFSENLDIRTPLEKVAVGCNALFLRNYLEEKWSKKSQAKSPN